MTRINTLYPYIKGMREVLGVLDRLITRGVEDATDGLDHVGIIFSGGIDSTLIALKAREFKTVECFTVGFEDSHDFRHARIAKDKGLNVTEILLDLDFLEEALIDVVNLVGEPNPLAAGVGVPMYLASKKAREAGLDVMLCGQGADELFGGYWRYVEAYVSNGPEAVAEWMRRDVATADADNLDRDRLVTSANSIELRFPFLLGELVEYSLNLPIEYRLREVDEGFNEYECVDNVEGRRFVRKYALRKVAEMNGVPSEIINRSKKAAQYGSSVHKHMEKLARIRGFKEKARDSGEQSYLKLYLNSLIR
ncbi:MAG TPA: hypothetical protein ENN13_02855 [Candidatus Altiarchaeales archaeon]|nr:hypothetical protein [Candidatus Altiarchaeales archaeon]